jgi:hypothetical protein
VPHIGEVYFNCLLESSGLPVGDGIGVGCIRQRIFRQVAEAIDRAMSRRAGEDISARHDSGPPSGRGLIDVKAVLRAFLDTPG